jgi:hypothetical protein
MKTLSVVGFALVVLGCGASVQPDDGAADGRSVGDGGVLDANVEAGASACLPLRRGCESNADCPAACSQCEPLVEWQDEAHTIRPRLLDRVCIPNGRGGAYYRGTIACDEPFEAAWTFGDSDELSGCVPREVCLAMLQLQATLTTSQLTRRCLSADGTGYLGSPIEVRGCHPRVANYCSTTCRCGEGKVCAFLSEQRGGAWGYCTIPYSSPTGQARPCRGGVNRVQCDSGMGCLQPIRNGVGGMADVDRWGICLPAAECTAGADPGSLSPIYNCDLR